MSIRNELLEQILATTSSGSGIGEAPIDGTPYYRQDADWLPAAGDTVTTGYTHVTPSNWASVLPAPVGDVITLTTGAYYFDGYIDISPNRLFIPPFEGIVLRGETSLKDTLVSNCIGGAMITGNDVLLGTIDLSLEAGAADDVIAITGTGSNLIMHFTDFFDYKNMVSFTDGTYFLWDNGFSTTTANSVSGFKFFGAPGIVYFTHCQAQAFKGTWIDLGSALLSSFRLESPTVGIDNTDNTQLVIDGLIDSGNIDPTKGGVGSITNAVIQDSSGTVNSHYTLGNIKSGDIRWGVSDVPDVIDSKVFMENQSENSTSQTILSDGVWSKITTDSPSLSPNTQRYFNNGTDLEYSGLKTTDQQYTITMSVSKVGGAVGNYEFAIFHNANADATTGTKISVILPMELKSTAQLITFSTSAPTKLGDFVGIYVRPVGTSDNIVVGALTSQIHG